jgi:hypothetical protein
MAHPAHQLLRARSRRSQRVRRVAQIVEVQPFDASRLDRLLPRSVEVRSSGRDAPRADKDPAPLTLLRVLVKVPLQLWHKLTRERHRPPASV